MLSRSLVFATLFVCFALGNLGSAQEKIADVLSDPKFDMRRAADRAQVVARLQAIEKKVATRTRAKAAALRLQMRIEKPDGRVMEIVDFKGDQPVYATTRNSSAAISTGANLVQALPYSLDGTGLMVGIWDAGSVRATHEEFNNGNRVTVMDGSAVNSHSTHVGGTLAAQGIRGGAKGMAPNALIRSYNWSSYISEMTSAAATLPNQLGTKIYVSNHSWGYDEGWRDNVWMGNGTDQTAAEHEFGQYETTARDLDSNLHSTPYHLIFWAVGNDGNDNPGAGQNVTIGGASVVYNPAIHPAGDGTYRNGFDSIAAHGLAKNLIAVGSVDDAVTAGARDPSKAWYQSLNSSGPTDDGRIKPDLMANGVNLTSSESSADDDYGTSSGTSMASPNAAGSALLVVDQYKRLFNSAMRASTLKGLLINTATDLGNPGPDYKNGWGLVDAKKAVDLVRAHHANPGTNRINESELTAAVTSRTYTFLWDGGSPLRATLCWTDPAGVASTAHDSRTPTLVNNLNLKLIAPNGYEYYPYVMPFVGTWTVASMNENASYGMNNTDNVETVHIPNPGLTGTWTAEVSYSGPLTGASQAYGLVVSGVTNNPNLVEIQSPVGGETFHRGLTYDITWNSNVAGSTSIMLLKGGVYHSMLTTDTPNDGSFSWTVPSNLPLAADYTIRVRNVPESALMETSGNITIADDSLPFVAEAVDNTSLQWTSGGNAPWFSQTTTTKDGVDALQSGALPSTGGISSVSTTVVGPGTLRFWHKVSSESGWDFLIFYLNGVWNPGVVQKISGEKPWTQQTVNIPAGTNTLEWRYDKDGADYLPVGQDAAWLDQVTYTPTAVPKIVVERSSGSPLKDDAAMFHFGTRSIGNASPALSFTVKNIGTADLTGLALSKKGTGQGDYTLGALGATTLAPGASTSFTVTFSPTATGLRAADLVIASSDSTQGPFDIDLLGAGTSDGLVVTPSAGLISSGNFGGPFSPTSISYILSNPGSTSINWTAAKTEDWVTLAPASGTLAAGASTTVTASIHGNASALASNSYADTITFINATNGSGNTTRSVSLTVNKLPQTITFDPLAPVLDDAAPFNLTATASSGLPVSYESSNPSVATISGSTVILVGAGSTTITASQAGNSEYSAATPVPQTLVVGSSNPVAVTSGPYKLLLNQSLVLNGSGSQPSPGQTITSYSWDLNNDNTFGDVTGVTPAALTYSTLVSTWGMIEGLNTIQLRVTDSADKTATVSTTVRLVATLTWDANHAAANQTDGAGVWLNANQWWDGSANQSWVAGSSATFGNAGAGGAVTLAAPNSINQLVFNAFTGTYTLGSTGSPMTIAGGIVKNLNSETVTMNSPLVLGAPQTWTNHANLRLNVSNALNNGGHRLTITGPGIFSFNTPSSVISGSGGITMNGTGRFFLSHLGMTTAHTYTGSTILNNGITLVSKNNLGTGNFVLNGGVFEAAVGDDFVRPLGIGNGEVQITGGASGFAQNADQSSSVIFGNDANFEVVWGSALFDPSTLVLQTQYSQGNSALNFQNKIDLNGANRTVFSAGGITSTATSTLSGVIRNSTGTAGLIKTGSGRLNLNAANTYNGGTTLSAGTLQLGHASALGATSGPLTVNAGTLNVNNQSLTVGNLSGSGGTIANNGSGAVTLSIGSGGGTGGNFQGVIANNTNSGTGTLALTKTGSGSIILSGANTCTGTTLVSQGKLFINGSLSNTAAALNVSSGATLGGTGTVGRNVAIASGGKLEFAISTDAANHNALDLSAGRDFTFGGASELTIISTSGAAPGTYTLFTGGNPIVGAVPGTVHLPANWTANVSISGNSLLLNVISVLDPFDAWASAEGLSGEDAALAANPDGDELENLLEYAFGTDPNSAMSQVLAYVAGGTVTAAGTPAVINFGTGQNEDYRAVFTRRKDDVDAGLTYTVQFSADLINWANSEEIPTILTGDGLSNPAAVEAVSVPYPPLVPSVAGSAKPMFFRLLVMMNP